MKNQDSLVSLKKNVRESKSSLKLEKPEFKFENKIEISLPRLERAATQMQTHYKDANLMSKRVSTDTGLDGPLLDGTQSMFNSKLESLKDS